MLRVLTPSVLLLLGPRRQVLDGTEHGAHRAAHDEPGFVLVDVLLRHPLVLVLGEVPLREDIHGLASLQAKLLRLSGHPGWTVKLSHVHAHALELLDQGKVHGHPWGAFSLGLLFSPCTSSVSCGPRFSPPTLLL